jgi:bifunctional DNA-binding transcriptional regulator/antitoxin component of YhaV-PrlF toxin-antitoxin module
MASKTATITKPERIRRVGQRRQVVIPREIFDELRMSVGDFVAITKRENSVVIKPKRVVDADDTLTPEEAKRLRQSLKQMRQGKTKPWAQVKDELGL